MMGNSSAIGNRLTGPAINTLRAALPTGWSVDLITEQSGDAPTLAPVIRIRAPDQTSAEIAIEATPRLEPRAAEHLAIASSGHARPMLAVAPWMSAATQARLRSAGINLLDLTGNIWLCLSRPGLHVRVLGATHDPAPPEHRPSLKGDRAAAVVRALCLRGPPIGVRQLAARAGASPGYVSKLLALLDNEAAVRRDADGRVTELDLRRLIERWSEDAPLEDRASSSGWIDPRGLGALLGRLAGSKERYAVTSSLAASRIAPVAPPRLASIYVADPEAFAAAHDLRRADAGANALLLEPRDPSVLSDVWLDHGIRYASLPLVAADLLSGPGRGPAEAEALIAWMVAHPEVWRG